MLNSPPVSTVCLDDSFTCGRHHDSAVNPRKAGPRVTESAFLFPRKPLWAAVSKLMKPAASEDARRIICAAVAEVLPTSKFLISGLETHNSHILFSRSQRNGDFLHFCCSKMPHAAAQARTSVFACSYGCVFGRVQIYQVLPAFQSFPQDLFLCFSSSCTGCMFLGN